MTVDMNKYLQLFRLGNGLMGIIGILVSAFIAAGPDLGDHWISLLISCFIVICFIAGGNSVNDYIDRDIDVTAHPERPIPSGRIEPRRALHIGICALALSSALSILLMSWIATAIVVVACVLMVSYELFLKQRGFVGNLTIAALTGMVFLLGGAIVGNMTNSFTIAALAALVTVGREITKDIEDMEGDIGRKTLPMSIGKRNAGVLAAAFFIAGSALSILPMLEGLFGVLYYTIFVADAMFIYSAIILFKSPHNAQKMAKIAMFAALVAFILGVIN